MFNRSRTRIALGYAGIMALILVLFSVVVVAGFWRQAVSRQDELLAREAEKRESIVNGGQPDGSFSGGSDEFGWSAVGPDGQRLARTTTGSALGLPRSDLARQASRDRRDVFATAGAPEGDVRVLSSPVMRSGDVVAVVQVAQSRDAVQETVRRLVFVLAPMGLVALVLAGIGGFFVSGRAMRPISAAFDKQRAFVADASHELKTPITLIRIDADMMSRTDKTPDDRELLEHLIGETERIDAVLSDLLTLARLDSGKLVVTREPFDLAEVLIEAADRFGKRATVEGIHLTVEISGKLSARGDRERTRQILAALLDNALRYTPPGGAVTMTGRSRDGRAETRIADSGPGIPPERLPRVFDRFYRAETARTRADGGTGLGLAIARDLARAQGGDITVGNAEDGGAVFCVSLPTAGREKP